MAEIEKFGGFEIASKKTCLSLRRKRQFVMLFLAQIPASILAFI